MPGHLGSGPPGMTVPTSLALKGRDLPPLQDAGKQAPAAESLFRE